MTDRVITVGDDFLLPDAVASQIALATGGVAKAAAEAARDAAQAAEAGAQAAEAAAESAAGTFTAPANDVVASMVTGAGATQSALDTRYGATVNAADNGVVGDGTTDDAAALQSLLNSAAALGASVTLAAGSTILCGSSIAVPSNTRLIGNGALLKKSSGLAGILFTITTASSIKLQDFRIDGQKALFTASEYQHGIYIISGSSNITLSDLDIGNCNGDGIYVGDQSAASMDITLNNVTSHDNSRQGMSISHVSGLEANACRFTGSTGMNPQAGVDIEPNNGSVVCENIKFTNCTFNGNTHFGFVVAFAYTGAARQGGIDLIGCTIVGNGVTADTFGGGLNLRAAVDFTMIGGTIRANTGPGVLIDWTSISLGSKLIGVTIRDNTRQGISVTAGFDNLLISDCTIRDNGTGSSGAYPAVGLLPTIASTNVRLIANSIEGATQRYGVQTNSSTTKVMFVANTYKNNALADRALSDDLTTRLDLDRGTPSAVTGSKGGNAALTSLLPRLAALGIIIDSTTA